MNQVGENGIIRIADNVVAVIASLATLETEGIAGMSGGIAEEITKRVSGKQVQKGVHVAIDEEETTIDLRLIVKMGHRIDQICRKVQVQVKEAVENMTGLQVRAVNVRVEGIELEKGKTLELT